MSAQSARLICGYIYATAGEGESTTDLVFGGQHLIAENGTILAEANDLRIRSFVQISMWIVSQVSAEG